MSHCTPRSYQEIAIQNIFDKIAKLDEEIKNNHELLLEEIKNNSCMLKHIIKNNKESSINYNKFDTIIKNNQIILYNNINIFLKHINNKVTSVINKFKYTNCILKLIIKTCININKKIKNN